MSKKVKPLTQEDMAAYYKAMTTAGSYANLVIERLASIVVIVMKAFGCGENNTYYWYFDGAAEGEVGQFRCYGGSIPYILGGVPKKDREKMNTTVNDYSEDLPEQFLYMSDEDIEKQIAAELKADTIKKIIRDAAKQQTKSEVDAIKESALAKLSNQEKKALGIDI